MEKWYGSAGICIDQEGRILMVLQGKTEEEKRWTIPSGGLETGETFAECCLREVWEETGYRAELIKPLFVKNGTSYGIEVEVHYFELRVIGGTAAIQDPDELIHEIAWKHPHELDELVLSFPEDQGFLMDYAAGVHS
ncbi:NUDIX hydrolase [Peribacillus kribbensis]|uniref:NUDIX hydrolase n=1 Tax=Peribacillus kribbensis TaxID=356658 RepID=UPI00041DE5E5|nr:NUDIX hydrolase [Peribacillus kribbensis]